MRASVCASSSDVISKQNTLKCMAKQLIKTTLRQLGRQVLKRALKADWLISFDGKFAKFLW